MAEAGAVGFEIGHQNRFVDKFGSFNFISLVMIGDFRDNVS